MAEIPRGFPRQNNVATIQRGIRASQQQFAAAERRGRQAAEEGMDIARLGATLVDIAGNVQEQDRVLAAREKAAKERFDRDAEQKIRKIRQRLREHESDLNTMVRDKTIADKNTIRSAGLTAAAEAKARAAQEDRPLDDSDRAYIQKAVEDAFGDGYAEAIGFDETSQYLDQLLTNFDVDAIAYNAEWTMADAMDANTNAFYVAHEAGDVQGMDDALEFSGYTATQREQLKTLRESKVTEIGVETQMQRIRDVAADDSLRGEDGVAEMNRIIEGVQRNPTISQAVKDQFAIDSSTFRSRYQKQLADEEAYGTKVLQASQSAMMVQLDEEAAYGDLTHEELNNIYSTNPTLYGLDGPDGPAQMRRLRNAIDARDAAQADAAEAYINVNSLLSTGTRSDSPDTQADVNTVFEGAPGQASPYADAYADWANLETPDKLAIISLTQTGVIPAQITADLSAARGTTNAAQLARAFEVYTLLEHTPTTADTARQELPESVRRYYDELQLYVSTGSTLAEAAQRISDREAQPAQAIQIMEDRYRTDTEDDANVDRLNELIKKEHGGWFSPVDAANPRVQAMYEELVRSNYLAGAPLESAQITAYKSLQTIMSPSVVNGSREMMTPAPEKYYGLTPEQVQDDVIDSIRPFLEDSWFDANPQVRLASDPLTLRQGGWQILYRTSEDGVWQPVTDENSVPLRWTYDPPTTTERAQERSERTERYRGWEEDFLKMSEGDKRRWGNSEYHDSARGRADFDEKAAQGRYVEEQERLFEQAKSDNRGNYFRDS